MVSGQFNSILIFIKKEKSSRNVELSQPLFRGEDRVFLAQGPDHRDSSAIKSAGLSSSSQYLLAPHLKQHKITCHVYFEKVSIAA